MKGFLILLNQQYEQCQLRLGQIRNTSRLQILCLHRGRETQKQQLQVQLEGGLPQDPPRRTQTRLLLQGIRTHRKTRTSSAIQLNDVANQKHQEEKDEQERMKKQSNVKEKKLASIKAEKVNKKYQVEEDSFSDEND